MPRTYGETLARELADRIDAIQHGTTTLVEGVSPVILARLTASSSIVVSHRNTAGGALGVSICARDADRVVGPAGSFRLTAIKADGATETLESSTIDWILVG